MILTQSLCTKVSSVSFLLLIHVLPPHSTLRFADFSTNLLHITQHYVQGALLFIAVLSHASSNAVENPVRVLLTALCFQFDSLIIHILNIFILLFLVLRVTPDHFPSYLCLRMDELLLHIVLFSLYKVLFITFNCIVLFENFITSLPHFILKTLIEYLFYDLMSLNF